MARKKATDTTTAAPDTPAATQPTARRVYEVMNSESGKIRMIETTSQARALRFVSSDLFAIKACTGSDVARNVRAGVTIEEDIQPEPSGEPQP